MDFSSFGIIVFLIISSYLNIAPGTIIRLFPHYLFFFFFEARKEGKKEKKKENKIKEENKEMEKNITANNKQLICIV